MLYLVFLEVIDVGLQHIFIKVTGFQFGYFAQEQILHFVQGLSFFGTSLHDESTVVRQIINISIGSQYFLLLVEVDVHQTGFAVVHNLADNLQCFIFFACRTGESPCQCHRFGIGTEHFAYYGLGNRCFRFDGQLRQIGVRLHIAEVLVDGGNHFIRIEITRQTDGHIVGHIPSFIIILDVGDGRIL